jgi:hypothetical protein
MSGNTVEHIKDAAPVLGKYFDIPIEKDKRSQKCPRKGINDWI